MARGIILWDQLRYFAAGVNGMTREAGIRAESGEGFRRQRIDALISTTRPVNYNAAVALPVDLRDVSRRKGRAAEFTQRIGALRNAHAKKPSLLLRLSKAGL